MKNKIAITSIIVAIIALSACTRTNTTVNTNTGTDNIQQTTSASSSTKASSSPSAFPATSDADVKAIDKMFDDSKSTDFDDKSLDELER